MLEIDSNEKWLDHSATATKLIWNAVRIECLHIVEPPIQKLVSAINKTHHNGGAKFAKFKIEGNSNFNWFMSHNLFKEIEFPKYFFHNENVLKALSDVCKEIDLSIIDFVQDSSFTFSGVIAEMLAHGGAYEKHLSGSSDAYAIAEDFRKCLFGDRFDEILVLNNHRPWSAWFKDVAWDYTWIIIDKRQSFVSVLAITDTD